MTVQCLTNLQKNVIVVQYIQKNYNLKELAKQYHTSERTINRVLIEVGVATPVARIQGEAYTVMQLLKEHGVDLPRLKQMLSDRVFT